MTWLIQTIADWLIASHTVSMSGWAWLIVAPAALIVLLVVGYFLAVAAFVSSFRLF